MLRARPDDLFRTVTDCSEDLVALRVWRIAKENLSKKGLTHSQTIAPSLVTSKKRPKEDSVINGLPFSRRWALPMRGEKKFQAGLSCYFQTISFVVGLISITREYDTES